MNKQKQEEHRLKEDLNVIAERAETILTMPIMNVIAMLNFFDWQSEINNAY